MLVLTRNSGESVIIGTNIVVTVLGTSGNQVRIGISAPNDVNIVREELVFSEKLVNSLIGGKEFSINEQKKDKETNEESVKSRKRKWSFVPDRFKL